LNFSEERCHLNYYQIIIVKNNKVSNYRNFECSRHYQFEVPQVQGIGDLETIFFTMCSMPKTWIRSNVWWPDKLTQNWKLVVPLSCKPSYSAWIAPLKTAPSRKERVRHKACGTQTGSININTWELIRNAESQTLPLTCWIRNPGWFICSLV
jgi:hypothetical protein